MPGNTLGARAYFKYTMDDGVTDFSILTDETLGLAAGLEKDDTLPPPPRRFKPRVVFCEAIVGGKKVRKALVVQANSTFYTNSSKTVPIDTIDFKSKGRRGESMSFGGNT